MSVQVIFKYFNNFQKVTYLIGKIDINNLNGEKFY